MDIRSSSLLKPTTKVIKPYDCSLIATEGPNMVGNLPLKGLQIAYDSVFTGTMTLKPKDIDKPIMYGFLGTNVTFLALIPTYNVSSTQYSGCRPNGTTTTTNCGCGTNNYTNGCSTNMYDNYLEYYFEDEPLIRRPFTDILVLTGNENHKIPQVYIYNPTNNTVSISIMCANIGDNDISCILSKTKTTFSNLSYASILSDKTIFIPGYTGSTQFEIYGGDNSLILTIPYVKVEVVEVDGNIVKVSTDSDEVISLEFLSEFNARQAHSRMSWVVEDYAKRYLTTDNPPVDDEAPIISFYSSPLNHLTGTTLTKDQIRELFISSVSDNRDGVINIYNVGIVIQKQNSIRQFEEITEPGTYNIYFSVADIAGNVANETKLLYMYNSAPRIVFKTTSVDDTIYINDSWYYKPIFDANFVSTNDIRTYYVDHVEDYVDYIPSSAVTIVVTPTSGLTESGITYVGSYDVTFSVSNQAGLTDTQYRTLLVKTDANLPPAVIFNSGFTSSVISGTTGLTESQFLLMTVCGITENIYDPYMTINDIIITGVTFPTVASMLPYTGVYSITNSSGIDNSSQSDRIKTIYIV